MIENREPAITETLRMEGGGQYTDRATDRGYLTRPPERSGSVRVRSSDQPRRW